MKQKFKYYHGTSTIFLDSIREMGLGAINPNIDYKNLDVLNYLFELAEVYLLTNNEYLKIRDTTTAIAKQTFLKVIDEKGNEFLHNYVHDGIYVALSRARAAIYASSNKYGSEILERCIVLYKLLTDNKIEFQIPKEINLFHIENYLDYDPKPIIVEIIDIADDKLEKEDGGNAKEALDFLREKVPIWALAACATGEYPIPKTCDQAQTHCPSCNPSLEELALYFQTELQLRSL